MNTSHEPFQASCPSLARVDTKQPINRYSRQHICSPLEKGQAERNSLQPPRKNLANRSYSSYKPSSIAKNYARNEAPPAHLPFHDLTYTPFADATICAAVDVSTSTRGLILSHEALAISTISHQLSKDAKHRGRVLPWSNIAHPVVRLTDSARLKPSYGTDPSVLCSDYAFSTALQECSLWFLLTDGQIQEEDIERFAQGVAENGLHGTACVIILFGYLPRRPVDLDTSVGVSVFAVAPNCLFLFHDVLDGQVYVIQCKGCFTSMLLETWENPSLGFETSWGELSAISYEELAHLRVPKPIRLDKDDVALVGGKIINMRDLYQDCLDQRSIPMWYRPKAGPCGQIYGII